MYKSPITFAALLALPGCITTIPLIEQEPSIGMSRFNSCESMNYHLTDSLTRNFAGYGRWVENDIGLEAGAVDDTASEDTPSGYSTTNVQEKGVDEPDMVKTDGEHIYLLNSGALSIVKSWPAEESEEVGTLALKGHPQQMFLSGDRLLIYSADWSEDEDRSWRNFTRLEIVDVSDRTEPLVIASKRLDGELVSARMIGDDVYTVINHSISLPESTYMAIWSAMEETYEDHAWMGSDSSTSMTRARMRDRIRPIIADAVFSMDRDDILPSVTHEDGEREPIIGCTDVYHSEEASDAGLTTVAHIDLGADTIRVTGDATGIMAGSTTLYASSENLYIAQSSFAWWDGFSDIERTTRIHQFSLDGERTRYTASGEVDGYLHNQFSMSEHEGLLRVATTYDDWSWGTSSEESKSGNNIFVLDAETEDMPIIGELTGLAPGEQIYATRFQGDRAFMVTFVQVDPLFTIDLSIPTAPEAKGELKIPGYSSYLHPIGKDHIIGVGMGGSWDGELSGVAISLFDVSDFSDPKQQDQVTLDCDSSWSEALFDHHATLVYGDTIAIPAYGWTDDGSWRETSGLMVNTVDTKTGLTTRGFVDHRPLVEALYCTDEEDCAETSYMPQMRRSIVIEDMLYSISDLGVMVSTLDDPERPVAVVPTI
jgi:uncharacterized secreted protein with C-terminal beta-propeller domain